MSKKNDEGVEKSAPSVVLREVYRRANVLMLTFEVHSHCTFYPFFGERFNGGKGKYYKKLCKGRCCRKGVYLP